MTRRTATILLAPVLCGLTALAACTPAIVPDPGGHRPATPPPAPRPVPPVAQGPDWEDWQVAPGNWTYARASGITIARFGVGGAVSAWVRCDLGARSVSVGRAAQSGNGTAMMTVRTSFGALQWPTRIAGGATPGTEAARGASDPGLDQIAFSRGRFTIELPGLAPLVLPTWAEPVRVIEDCRG
ncbi:MAG TPA: hypothetical protein VF503_03400 [Sphingobium sp.]|uniref:hypothetical protein n=1 Tax=Sphingobium sp. TaxID=1912891 RepID=UPI002ED471AC